MKFYEIQVAQLSQELLKVSNTKMFENFDVLMQNCLEV